MGCRINLTDVRTREQFQDRIAERLSCPPYYGKNLDALYDVLCEYCGELVFEGFADFVRDMPGYGAALRKLCEDAVRENPALSIVFE